MSDSFAVDEPGDLVRGADAFDRDDLTPSEARDASLSRAGQYLGMAAYAFGGDELAADMQEDAELLQVPHIASVAESLRSDLATQDALDDLTAMAMREYGVSGGDLETAAALRAELDAVHDPAVLLALLNERQRSEVPVEAAAAAAGLLAFAPDLDVSRSLLERALASDDSEAAGIAAATLGVAIAGRDQSASPLRTSEPVSTAIHGTWALVTEQGWHKPTSGLHQHLRAEATGNLYARDGYFLWTGDYDEWARRRAAYDLIRWRSFVTDHEDLDTVYAHSHGGNVALNAAAAGQKIKMLVLLHTPAIRRTDAEWAEIRRNVGQVVVMRTRMDLVVAADALRGSLPGGTPSGHKFPPSTLPHFSVQPHPFHAASWFSHSFYVTLATWERAGLADIVKARYRYVEE